MGDDKDFYKQKHEINITFASQMRMHDILNRIVDIDSRYPIDSPEKQKCYLNLVKQYFISAVPYISEADANKYKDEILSFSVKQKSNVRKGSQKYNYIFDSALDKRLNQILVELQIKLRRVLTRIRDPEDEGL